MRVKVDFINDSSSPAATKLSDLVFIIEEPRPSFFSKACKYRDSTDSVCWARWEHIQCFHFVYASHHQAALYSRLDVPHYSEVGTFMKAQISKFMDAHPGLDCGSLYHLPDRNSITPFLIVLNVLPAPLDSLFDELDWTKIAQTPYSQDEMASKESGVSVGQERHFLHADYGNTSGLNQSRADDPSGMARPVILNGTSKHTSLFVQCTEFIKLLAPYLGISSEEVYADPDYPERKEQFRSVIHPDNIVEALRMAIITCILKCGCHRDIHNCNTAPGMMLVMVLS